MFNDILSQRKFSLLLLLITLIVLMIIVGRAITPDSYQVQQEQQNVVTEQTAEKAADVNVLQNDLKVNKGNAKAITSEVQRAHTGAKEPAEHYTYKTITPSTETALQEVTDKVKKKDSALPPLALKDTDKTLVAPSMKEPSKEGEVNVDVYKINTYRNWELGIGVGTEDGNTYIPLSLQRNYSKNHSVAVEIHLDPKHNMKVSGTEIQWKIHFGK